MGQRRSLIDKMPELDRAPTSQPIHAGKTVYLVPRGANPLFAGAEGPQGPPIAEVKDSSWENASIVLVEAAPERAVVWTKPAFARHPSRRLARGLHGGDEQGHKNPHNRQHYTTRAETPADYRDT